MKEFNVGRSYSRQQISAVLGGSIRAYLPLKDGKVVCGCFKREPKYNPGAPEEVTVGEGPTVERAAEVVARQNAPIPLFLFKSGSEWEYLGLYRCLKQETDSDFLRRKEQENPARGVITRVLYFRRA